MERSADTKLFSHAKRPRIDGTFVIGFVGRLSAEKNLRFLKKIEEAFLSRGYRDYRFLFLIVGHGAESAWLKANLKRADVPGVLKGEDLAADMDVFAFPSHTDTYGNVVTEAHTSGVPTVVTADGGPKFLVKPGVTGMVSGSEEEFIHNFVALYEDRALQSKLREQARRAACEKSWEPLFTSLIYKPLPQLPNRT